MFDLSRGNWDILFYSTLTLLFHACSAVGVELQISPHCFNAARNSLQAHLNFFPQYQKSQLLSDADYFNWYAPFILPGSTSRSTDILRILLSSSFIPFIVTFLHAIAAKDMENVTLLEQVVGTLENFRNASQGSERFYQICATFTQIAKRLVQQEQSPIGVYNEQQDSLSFPDISQGTSTFHPGDFQDAFQSGTMSFLNPSSTTDILNDWLSGPPFPWEIFDGDFENR